MILILTLISGFLFIFYGIYLIILRVKNPLKLKKLTAMQKAFGVKIGYIIHFIFYSFLPLNFGLY